MPNYRTWIKYVSVNIIFHLVVLLLIVVSLIFGESIYISGPIIALSVCILMITVNSVAVYSIKRSQKYQLPISKPAKFVAMISLIGITIITLFGVNPSSITPDLFTKEKN